MQISRLVKRMKFHPASLAAALLGFVMLFAPPSCEKKHNTPDWNTPGDSPPPPVVVGASTAAAEVAPAPASDTPASPRAKEVRPPAIVAAKEAPTTGGLRFITYNVENWLTMDRYVDRQALKGSPKPDKEKRAAIQMISRSSPDVLGLCEIGSREDLGEIQAALKADGVDLPHVYYTGGSDEVRHLGLLSRFPIVSTATPKVLEYKLNGSSFTMNRGILDATINAHDKSYRFLGVHLKSKREVEEGDEEAMRRNEAGLLRQHLDSILNAEAKARLVVYGDFNDFWGSSSLKTITGNFNDPTYLTAIRAQDKQGLYWTHYWALHDIYSRFDFIAVSQGLKPDVDFKKCHIIDDPEWIDASDHRPVMAIFK